MDKQEHNLRVLASDMAAADALPGGLVHALEDGTIQVGNVNVRKAWVGDMVIFRLIDSPIQKMISESQKPKEIQDPIDYSTEDEIMLMYQFTNPIADVYKVAKQGKQEFLDKAMEVIGFNTDFSSPVEIIKAITEQIAKAFKMKINYEPTPEAGDAGTKKLSA